MGTSACIAHYRCDAVIEKPRQHVVAFFCHGDIYADDFPIKSEYCFVISRDFVSRFSRMTIEPLTHKKIVLGHWTTDFTLFIELWTSSSFQQCSSFPTLDTCIPLASPTKFCFQKSMLFFYLGMTWRNRAAPRQHHTPTVQLCGCCRYSIDSYGQSFRNWHSQRVIELIHGKHCRGHQYIDKGKADSKVKHPRRFEKVH